MSGAGEPPVPGTSKRITAMAGSRASTNCWSTSRLTPIPFSSSSGVRVPSPLRMATRRRCPLTVMARVSACGLVVSDAMNHPFPLNRTPRELSISRLEHVGAGGRCSRLILGATQFSWCRLLFTGALAQPVAPILPPGACAFLRSSLPLSGIGRVALVDEVRRLRVAWWVQQGLDVATVTQDKGDLASQQLGGCIASLPWRDVVSDACDDIGIVGHFGQINRRPQHLEGARMGKRIGFVQVEQVAMQFGGQARRVVIPVEHVKGCRILADQVIVDPVVPDQIVGAQP